MYIFQEDEIFFQKSIEGMMKQGLMETQFPVDSLEGVKEILNRLFEKKVMDFFIPPDCGGLNGCSVTQMILLSLIAKENPTISHILGAHFYGYVSSILDFGSVAQNEIYIRQALLERKMGTLAYTEPTGCSFDSMNVRAVETEDGYVLNGVKSMVTFASESDYILTFARTSDSGNPFQQFSMFIVDVKDADGISFGAHEELMGMEGLTINEVRFENCTIKKEQRLGNEGDGVKILIKQLEKSRLASAANVMGMADRAYHEALQYSLSRMINNAPMLSNPIMNQKLALMKVKLETIRLLTFQAANRYDREDQGVLYYTSIAKYQTSQFAKEICDEALQVFGGYGYMKDYIVERLYRAVRLYTIVNGTSELVLMAIGSMLMQEQQPEE